MLFKRTLIALLLATSAVIAQAQQGRRMQVIDSLLVPGGVISVAATNQGVAPVVIRTPYGASVSPAAIGPLHAFADSVELIINAHDPRVAGDTLVYGAQQAGLRFYRTIDDRSDRLRIVAAQGMGSHELMLTRDQAGTVVSMMRRAIEAANAMPPYDPRIPTPQAPVADDQIYFAFQVEHQARIAGDKPTPRYPAMLKSANVGGEVLAQFVVDTTGQVEPNSFKVLRTTHNLFTQSVKELLPTLRFAPAELRGVKVRQLVQMPFAFAP